MTRSVFSSAQSEVSGGNELCRVAFSRFKKKSSSEKEAELLNLTLKQNEYTR